MGGLIVIAGLVFFGAVLLRRAVPIAIATALGWAIWSATHDLPTTCAGFIAALLATAVMMDIAASSSFTALRSMVVGIELIVASAAGLLAFALLHESQSGFALTVATISASLFGSGAVLAKRRLQRLA